jgi:type II secretory pathway component GspD/PulD (secretin)
MMQGRLTGAVLLATLLAGWSASAWSQKASTDVPARRLMITVAHDIAADAQQQGVGVGSGGVSRESPRVRIYDLRSSENVKVLQRVQALEGRTALIQTGQSVPVPQRQVARSMVGGRVVEHVVDGVEYRNTSSGFLVTPRLAGDRVTLDVSAQREVFTPTEPGAIDTQRVTTSVSGRLGEWIEVAGVSEERGNDREVILGRAGGTRAESRTVFLKVEELR